MTTARSADGTLLAFERTGGGPPAILVDGAFCSRSLGPMPGLAPLLAERFTVLTYDRRGRNESGDTGPYAVEREIEDLDALIGQAGGSAFVYGVSSGAALALRAAAAGLAIAKLALFEPPYVRVNGNGGHVPPPDHQARLARLVSEDRRGEAVKFFMTGVMGMPSLFVIPMRLSPIWSKLKAVAHTLPYDAAVMGDYSPPADLAAAVRVPTLVMRGQRSPAALGRAAEALAGALANGQLLSLEGQTHNASPSVVAPVLSRFFAA